MQTYAAIDLHSNNGVLTVIDETDRILRQKKLANKLELFAGELEPFRATLQGVAVESTFNWYWLIDGLLKHGFPMKLVNTAAMQQYSGLKNTDDPYDAWWLARMMRLGILATGYIYPREERAVRDLLRKRSSLVQQRTANILSVQNLEQRNRGIKISSGEVKKLTEKSIGELYDNEDLGLALTTTVNVIGALTEQIRCLEKAVLKKARLRDEFKLLLTVWGVGDILGLTIMYEAGDMSRFAGPDRSLRTAAASKQNVCPTERRRARTMQRTATGIWPGPSSKQLTTPFVTTRKRSAFTTAKQHGPCRSWQSRPSHTSSLAPRTTCCETRNRSTRRKCSVEAWPVRSATT